MKTVKRRCHIKALSENLELGLIGGLMASVVDSFWCLTDMIHNGASINYLLILTVLLISCVILGIATVRHHRNNVKQQICVLTTLKKELLKKRNKHNKKLVIKLIKK